MDEISSTVQEARTVADRLRGARRRWFVGRRAELELFRHALGSADPPFSVLWVHGPGGVGKTTLLGAFAEEATHVDHAPVVLDLRGTEPSPPAFATELARACGVSAGTSASEALAGLQRPVLLLDTFEAASGLEDWLREVFVPALPAGALTVIAGRTRPGEQWGRDPGWRDLLRVVSLRNLGPDDARALIAHAGVAEELHERMLELTHGHPLALSQAEFAGAVRRALRDCCRPGDLAANPLARTRLVRDQGGTGEALRQLIGQAVEALRADPHDAKLARALERTYLKPAPTQEAAAELLGLPFSTYRGHLARAIERVTDWLWQRELYGPGSAASR